MSSPTTPLGRVRFDELALFVEVAEAGSIAAAARRLGVPKSTVGRALARMETDLGVALVRRMARGPALTEQGLSLARLAAPHVAALRDATMAVGHSIAEAYGTLRVTAPVDVGQEVLGPLAAAFAARYPRIRLDVELSTRMVDLEREGFDIAIRLATGPLPSSSLVARRIAKLEMGLYAGASYLARRDAPKRIEDLAKHDHVVFQGRDGRSVLALTGPNGTVRIPTDGRIGSNDFVFLREAIAEGAGIGTLPCFLARTGVDAGRLRRVLPAHAVAGGSAYLVHLPGRPLPRKIEAFRDFVLEHAPRIFAA
jgi:DNA-binding transcriptional LysR family regulator